MRGVGVGEGVAGEVGASFTYRLQHGGDIGDEDGDVAVLRAGKEMELIYEVNMGSSVYTTPIPKDGVLYIASRNTLFAIAAP
mgnify:CR=1 FL=1